MQLMNFKLLYQILTKNYQKHLNQWKNYNMIMKH